VKGATPSPHYGVVAEAPRGSTARKSIPAPPVLVLNGASTALARNALREAGAPVFLALRYTAAYRPTCHEARVLCPEGARNAPAIPDILVLAKEGANSNSGYPRSRHSDGVRASCAKRAGEPLPVEGHSGKDPAGGAPPSSSPGLSGLSRGSTWMAGTSLVMTDLSSVSN
jgi:hypothetical protein